MNPTQPNLDRLATELASLCSEIARPETPALPPKPDHGANLWAMFAGPRYANIQKPTE